MWQIAEGKVSVSPAKDMVGMIVDKRVSERRSETPTQTLKVTLFYIFFFFVYRKGLTVSTRRAKL